jgi:hypothetical protein
MRAVGESLWFGSSLLLVARAAAAESAPNKYARVVPNPEGVTSAEQRPLFPSWSIRDQSCRAATTLLACARDSEQFTRAPNAAPGVVSAAGCGRQRPVQGAQAFLRD